MADERRETPGSTGLLRVVSGWFQNGLDRRAAVLALTVVVGSSIALASGSSLHTTRVRTASGPQTSSANSPSPSSASTSTSVAMSTTFGSLPVTAGPLQVAVSAAPTTGFDSVPSSVEAPNVAPQDTAAPPPAPTTPEAPPKIDTGNPQVVARPIPAPAPAQDAPPGATVAPWESSTTMTAAGYVSTNVGCAANTSAGALDAFFKDRVGPVIGADYQHVYPLGGDRYLWLFQDAFIDHGGNATTLGKASFAHNVAFVQSGACFTMLHRGTAKRPAQFESGTGTDPANHWFWPMGGEMSNGRLQVYWVEEMVDGSTPGPGDGLGWHPIGTYLATYDVQSLARLSFDAAPNAGVAPIYGYAVSSDSDYTYLFGNSFEQNLTREGGYWNGPHSATRMYLARVPKGVLTAAPQYRTATDWSTDPTAAVAIVQRYWAENPMEPRYLGGQWVAATKVDGYWGSELSIDVAVDPWGPWTTVERRAIAPRNDDSTMNTYHAYLMPWRSGGNLVVSISQNGRNMAASAFPHPERYRIAFFSARFVDAPPNPPPATVPPDTTLPADTTLPDTTVVATTGASTTVAPTTAAPSTTAPTTAPPTTAPPTTAPPTTAPPTAAPPTAPPTTAPPSTPAPTTVAPTTSTGGGASTTPATTAGPTTRPASSAPTSTAAALTG